MHPPKTHSQLYETIKEHKYYIYSIDEYTEDRLLDTVLLHYMKIDTWKLQKISTIT